MIRNRYLAAVNDKPWWLAGGIPASACVIAYRAKGASSLAGSYINLANPGRYTATEVGTAPTLTTDGWFFDGGATYGLNTNLACGGHWSVIVKFKRVNTNSSINILSAYVFDGGARYHGINHDNAVNKTSLYDGGGTRLATVLTLDAVACLTAENTYVNNIAYGKATAGNLPTTNYFFGRVTTSAVEHDLWVASAAIYYSILTTYQVAALTAAMNAL